MIGSIRKAWQSADPGKARLLGSPDAEQRTITRARFLRVMAAGTLAAGIGGTARATVDAPPRRVAPVTEIDKLYDAWQVRFNAGDLEGLVDLYFDDVTYVNPDGKLMIGKARVREDFIELLALKPQIVLGDRRHVLYQDIALTTNHWRMNFNSADGVKQELTGGGIEVMRKQADGGWRYIIDDASRSASK
ncbi:MAG: SgcJ/EcaC family oxidoreductase [Sphingomonas bacterium]